MSNDNQLNNELFLDLEHELSNLKDQVNRWEDLYRRCSDRETKYRARMYKYEWIQNIIEYFGDLPWKFFPHRTNTNSK